MSPTVRRAALTVAALALALAVVVPLTAAMQVSSPKKVPGSSTMRNAACPPSGSCVALGQRSGNKPGGLVVTISGAKESAKTVPVAAFVTGIACPRAGACIAVGQGIRSAGVIFAIKNGVPGKVRTVKATLQGIGCSKSFSCWVTGFLPSRSANQPKPAIGHVQGPKVGTVRMKEQKTSAVLAAGEGSSPPAPACASAAKCVGVGTANLSKGPGIIYTLRNGTMGSVQKVPGTVALGGLSCVDAHHCLATGFSNTRGMVVRIVNGKPLAARPVTGTNYLGTVGCRTASSCVAFGLNKSNKPVIVPIIGGAAKRPQSTPVQVTGVACNRASCIGVGSRGTYPHMSGFYLRLF